MHTTAPHPGFSSAGKCPEFSRACWNHPWLMRFLLPVCAAKSKENAAFRGYLFHAGSGAFVHIVAQREDSPLHFRFEKFSHDASGKPAQPRVTLTYAGPFSGLADFAKQHQLLFVR